MQRKSHFRIRINVFAVCWFLNIKLGEGIDVSALFEHLLSSTFEQYRDNTDNRDNFGNYNRDKTFSYRCIPRVLKTLFALVVSPVELVNKHLSLL